MEKNLKGKYLRLFELAKDRAKKQQMKKLRKERMEEMSGARVYKCKPRSNNTPK